MKCSDESLLRSIFKIIGVITNFFQIIYAIVARLIISDEKACPYL